MGYVIKLPFKKNYLFPFVIAFQTHPMLFFNGASNLYLRFARRGMVEWVARVTTRHGFFALMMVLAVNYLDQRFLSDGDGLRL